MICKHCELESSKDEGVEVVRNEPITNENGEMGQLTEKRLYLSRFFFALTHIISHKYVIFYYYLVVYRHGFGLSFLMYFISPKKRAISIHIRLQVEFCFSAA